MKNFADTMKNMMTNAKEVEQPKPTTKPVYMMNDAEFKEHYNSKEQKAYREAKSFDEPM